jgi:hypothetical protein
MKIMAIDAADGVPDPCRLCRQANRCMALRRFASQIDCRASAIRSAVAVTSLPCSHPVDPAPHTEPCHVESCSFNRPPAPPRCNSMPRRLSGRCLPGRHDAGWQAPPDRTRPGRHIGSRTKIRNSGSGHAHAMQGLSGGGLLFSAARCARLLGARSGMPTDMPVKPADWAGARLSLGLPTRCVDVEA